MKYYVTPQTQIQETKPVNKKKKKNKKDESIVKLKDYGLSENAQVLLE